MRRMLSVLVALASASTPVSGQEASHDIVLKSGKLQANMSYEDIVCTNNLEIARKQREKYPDRADASFIYAVALSRTSHVEEALKEVRRARKLAESQGGAAYFDEMIESYEKMLTYYPDDNQVRYHLAWAYYMKAYVLARYSGKNKDGQPMYREWVEKAAKPGESTALTDMAHIGETMKGADQGVKPQIQNYYSRAIEKLDQVLASEPNDAWARVYRAHLNLEAGGSLDDAVKEWQSARDRDPLNPAPYFFLAEGFLKSGNLKDCLKSVSKAVALRADMSAAQSKEGASVTPSEDDSSRK